TTYRFQKLLLATGGAPRRLPLETDQIIYFRTLDDYRRLRALASQSVRFAVIGGGFIGSEVAAALRMQGRDVTMLVPEAGLGARVFPADLAAFLVDYYRGKGVARESRTPLRPATTGTSRIGRWAHRCAWSTKATPTRWAAPPASTWRGGRLPITSCGFSTPTCSSWATKRWATSTPVSRPSPTGRSGSAKAWSTT